MYTRFEDYRPRDEAAPWSAGGKQLTSEWLQAEQRAQELVDAIQRSALQTVPVVPLGQMLPNTAYRNSLQGVLTASAPFFWNVRKG